MERLKLLRESKRLTQIRLSVELGVSQETISGYETGKAIPPADMLVKLADILDTSVDYLLGRTDVKVSIQATELQEAEAEIISTYRRQSAERKACIYEMFQGLSK